MRAGWRALLAAALVASCDDTASPRDQWIIAIGTDAVVPQIGDRLLVEIVAADGSVCPACRRQFGVAEPGAWPVTLGVAPDGDRALGVRVRLYRTAIIGDDGFPATDRHLDAFARLPEAVGVTHVGLSLPMSCFGVAADPVAGTSCDPSTGAPGTAPELIAVEEEVEVARPGSWPFAGPSGCDDVAPPEGMVCVPGGTFLLGAPRFVPLVPDLTPAPEQLVQLAPFFIDIDEMTVGALRPLVDAGRAPEPLGPDPMCSWGRGDALPVNCVSWEDARTICIAAGKRLPTEAEWEYVASNLQRETRFPWLDETAEPCAQAVVDQQNEDGGAGRCRPSGEATGPLGGGSALDVSLLGVRNLGGNLSEWVLDELQPFAADACWGPSAAIRSGPVCAVPNERGTKVLKGGSWTSDPAAMRAASRNAGADGTPGNGLRCVLPF